MRVLHIFNEINFSGAEIMYANAAKLFQENGFELFAISTGEHFGNFTDQFEKAGIKIFHKPFNPKSLSLFYINSYLKNNINFINEHKIDIIHIHRSNVYWYFALCGYITNRKTFMTFHNNFKAGKFTWIKHYLTRFTARKFLNLTFQSIGKSVYLNELNYFKNPTLLINNWYDSTRFFPAADEVEKQSMRQKLDISLTAFVIISTGSCTAIKNHEDIIRALAAVSEKAEFVYLHLGCGILEPYEKQLAAALGVSKNIKFLGNRLNVRDYLIASDLFIMTSKFEGLSIASIEAMACKLPSILYNSPGLKDLISDNDNGLLISPNLNQLIDGIMMFKNNIQLAHEKALKAKLYVGENYFMPLCVNKVVEMYQTDKR